MHKRAATIPKGSPRLPAMEMHRRLARMVAGTHQTVANAQKWAQRPARAVDSAMREIRRRHQRRRVAPTTWSRGRTRTRRPRVRVGRGPKATRAGPGGDDPPDDPEDHHHVAIPEAVAL